MTYVLRIKWNDGYVTGEKEYRYQSIESLLLDLSNMLNDMSEGNEEIAITTEGD